MINRVVIFTKSITFKSLNKFATDFSDPYYILGVQKNADISQIKKAFYKLANEYHPDKIGDNQEGSKKFLLIKQAYQAIKMQKGLIKPSGFVYDTDTKSMRPDPNKFQTDDQQNRKSQADYKMYQQKAQASGQQYQQFKGTFKTLNDINDIKIRVQKGQMKDASTRFNLDQAKAKIQKLSNNSISVGVFVIAGMTSFYMFHLNSQNKRQVNQLQNAVSKQQQKQSKRRAFDQQQVKQQKIVQQIQKNKQLKQYLQKITQKNVIKSYSRKKQEVQTGQNSA